MTLYKDFYIQSMVDSVFVIALTARRGRQKSRTPALSKMSHFFYVNLIVTWLISSPNINPFSLSTASIQRNRSEFGSTTSAGVASWSDCVQAFIVKAGTRWPVCVYVWVCECVRKLTGRWWGAAVCAQSSVKCVCSSDHNAGLPSDTGKRVPALNHCCVCLLPCFLFFSFFL